MDMNASKPVPDTEEEDVEEAAPGNKSALDNLVEGFWLFKTAFDFFYYVDPSMTQTLKLKQWWKNNWYQMETFSDKLKSKMCETEIALYFYKIGLSI